MRCSSRKQPVAFAAFVLSLIQCLAIVTILSSARAEKGAPNEAKESPKPGFESNATRAIIKNTVWEWYEDSQPNSAPKGRVILLDNGKLELVGMDLATSWDWSGDDLKLYHKNGKAYVFHFDLAEVQGHTIAYPGAQKQPKTLRPTTAATSKAVPADKTPFATPTARTSKPNADAPAVADLVRRYRNSLVFVSGSNGAGSGFIAASGSAQFLFTNAHVAAGVKGAVFKSLDGALVQGSAPCVAVEHDVFRMTVPPIGQPLELMDHIEQNALIGDAVTVLGNAEGAGVINGINGKITGIGPTLVEVDAPFVPGNSGSPIIHLKTGKVIGVATYSLIKRYDAETLRTPRAPVIRRFGYRVDSVKTWQPVNWDSFAAQAGELENIDKLTYDLSKLLTDLGKSKKLPSGVHTNPAFRSAIDRWQTALIRNPSPGDRSMANGNFVGAIKSACQNDVAAAHSRMSYDYFQRELTQEQHYRDDFTAYLDKIFGAP